MLIRWYDNIPVLSWLLLRGRCRNCGNAISWRYPVIEFAVGIWFAVQAARLHTLLNFYFWSPNRVGTTSDATSGIILNLAVGGSWPGSPDSTTHFPQQMLVDYVRVYTRK